VEDLLRIGSPTSAEASISPKILMDYGNLPPKSVQICYDLTDRSRRFPGILFRGALVIDLFQELAALGEFPIAVFVEDLPQRLSGYEDLAHLHNESDNRLSTPNSLIAILEQG
jgi:hypothetical protein